MSRSADHELRCQCALARVRRREAGGVLTPRTSSVNRLVFPSPASCRCDPASRRTACTAYNTTTGALTEVTQLPISSSGLCQTPTTF